MMDMHSKHQLTLEILGRYLQAIKKEKGRILDEYCANTGYNRKYAIWKLKHYQLTPRHILEKPRRKRRKIYDGNLKIALIKIWEALDCICSNNLKPFIPEMIRILKKFKELEIDQETEEKLLKVSRSTIDELLKNERKIKRRKLNSGTRPGSLLKKEIPLRIGPWEETKPGFGEIDLVSHSGDSAAGEFAHTLNYTDIHTGWIEREAILGKAQERVHWSLQAIKVRLPFKLLGIDSDNDGSIINYLILNWSKKEKVVFTRSRSYRKNDNAYVEQKNWTCVRRIFGYIRIDKPKQIELMNELFTGPLRLYTNFFQPIRKCIEKKRIGSKIIKRYDQAKTPYQRVLECPDIPEETKKELTILYQTLNPITLKKEIDRILDKIYDLRTAKSRPLYIEINVPDTILSKI